MNAWSDTRFRSWALAIACGVIAAAGSVALSPAIAEKTVSTQPSLSTCNNSTQCFKRINQGTGTAIKGISDGGNGQTGDTIANNARTAFAGVLGEDLATPNPAGTPLNNAGVWGTTQTGTGVRASANTGTGIVASANGGDGIFATTQSNLTGVSSAGVFGEDVGNSSQAAGVTGFSGTGIGVQGDQFERGRFLNAAFLGLTFASSINTYFPAEPPGGLFNSDIGEGVVAESAGASAETLAAANFGGGPLMRAYASKTEILDLDNGGNMVIAGGLTQHGSPHMITHTASAGNVVMYAPMQAVATVEDVGEAQLTAGSAYVRIDPRFAATMNARGTYLVFLTPQGDTPGLYVAQKSAQGFTVREHGARSNIAFDFRIVAQPVEAQGGRLMGAPRMPATGFARMMTTHKPKVLPNGGIDVR